MLRAATVADLTDVLRSLRDWQQESGPMQLHPGDLGWFWRFGAEATASALRIWNREGPIRAVGLLDGGEGRLALAPDGREDAALANEIAGDVSGSHGHAPSAPWSAIEIRWDGPLTELLRRDGWEPGPPWTPLSRELRQPIEASGLKVEAIGPAQASARVAVQRASFDGSTFSEDRWKAMAAGPAYADARCLLAYDPAGNPVAAATVWSAGPEKPGLLEPLGVHRDHRGLGYGRAIALAAAGELQRMGASSATVCTPSSNLGAVATYRSAGFRAGSEVRDLRRPSRPST